MPIEIAYTPLDTLYGVLYNTTGNIWNGTTFVAPGAVTWTTAAQAFTESPTNSGEYNLTFPTAITTPGKYSIYAYRQVGGSASIPTDPLVGSGAIDWTGTAEVGTGATAGKISLTDETINYIGRGGVG